MTWVGLSSGTDGHRQVTCEMHRKIYPGWNKFLVEVLKDSSYNRDILANMATEYLKT